MIYITPRHAPVFSMTSIRDICNFAELNVFKIINQKYSNSALSLETTCRINELNKKIINCNDSHLNIREINAKSLELNPSDIAKKLKILSQSLADFNSHLIEYKSPDDFFGMVPGSYLFYSNTNHVPNIDQCHAFFALSNSLKCEISLNRFEDVPQKSAAISFGAVMI